jgi:hypothetical protein
VPEIQANVLPTHCVTNPLNIHMIKIGASHLNLFRKLAIADWHSVIVTTQPHGHDRRTGEDIYLILHFFQFSSQLTIFYYSN